jgi:hypothetical protein
MAEYRSKSRNVAPIDLSQIKLSNNCLRDIERLLYQMHTRGPTPKCGDKGCGEELKRKGGGVQNNGPLFQCLKFIFDLLRVFSEKPLFYWVIYSPKKSQKSLADNFSTDNLSVLRVTAGMTERQKTKLTVDAEEIVSASQNSKLSCRV